MTRPALPSTAPLPATDLDQAFALQQRLVAGVAEAFPDGAMFRADVGVVPGLGRPETTARAERVLAAAFDAPAACLVQGAGTAAIRTALSAGPWAEGDRRLLLHDAPDYSTTATTLSDGAVTAVRVDLDDAAALDEALADPDGPAWVFVQHTRQRLTDSFDPTAVVEAAVRAGRRVVVDDNYAVVRTPTIGVQHGASASAFSLFKLHGPEGVGVVLGDQDLVERAHRANYSGGGQVQGAQALAALQALVMVPLNWAVQARETRRVAERLAAGEVPGVVDAVLANAQDLCVLALLDEPVAADLPARAASVGAAPFPVGSNSRHEITPMVYRLSSSTLAGRPDLRDWAVRVNPMRGGADLTIDLLRRALDRGGVS
ncbi:MAG: aminotransferase class V-fold PLP-dependent enzyme [Nocardioidaceae bacterium]|nr:aminotransferase class V-fold PLP-dependent enzyme [Nocardioidaceae bacterium]